MNGLKKRRTELHITQEQLTARLAVAGFTYSPGTISHWENSRHSPENFNDPAFRKALADALDWNENELMRELGYTSELNPSPEALRAAELVDKMSPSRRKMAIGLLEKMLEY